MRDERQLSQERVKTHPFSIYRISSYSVSYEETFDRLGSEDISSIDRRVWRSERARVDVPFPVRRFGRRNRSRSVASRSVEIDDLREVCTLPGQSEPLKREEDRVGVLPGRDPSY